MKRIALCFSGALRTFPYCCDSILANVVRPLEGEYHVTIFGHFWKITKHDINDLEFNMKMRQDDENTYDKLKLINFQKLVLEDYNKDTENEIISFYNANEIMETYKIDPDTKKKDYAYNCMSMYYKIYKANQLKSEYEITNGVVFDYVIRLRPDFFWHEKINVTPIVAPTHNPIIMPTNNVNSILLVYDSYCTRAKWEGNDKFFMLTSDNMDTYTNLKDVIMEMYKNGVQIEGQHVARYMIQKLKFKILFFGSEKTYDKVNGRVYNELRKAGKIV